VKTILHGLFVDDVYDDRSGKGESRANRIYWHGSLQPIGDIGMTGADKRVPDTTVVPIHLHGRLASRDVSIRVQHDFRVDGAFSNDSVFLIRGRNVPTVFPIYSE